MSIVVCFLSYDVVVGLSTTSSNLCRDHDGIHFLVDSYPVSGLAGEMIENIDTSSLAGSLAAALTGIASLAFFMRKKLASDNTEIARNRAEENIILSLEKQRDFAFSEREKLEKRIQELDVEKDEAILKVVKLTQEVENLSGQVKLLRDLMERLGNTLDITKQQLNHYIQENTRLIGELERFRNDIG